MHLRFTEYEWQHLMFKPFPLFYWDIFTTYEPFRFTNTIPLLNFMHNVGIVYLIYPKSLLSCYTSIAFVREYGNVQYPIELWYHSDETSPELLSIFEDENIVLQDLKSFNLTVDSSIVSNYHFKSVAILNSNFKKVIYIDADALIVSDLNVVLNSDNLSVIAARDYWYTPPSNPIYKLLNKIGATTNWDMEAGFLVVDRSDEIIIKSLQMAMEMNLNHNVFYNFIHGDKDTFKYAFEHYNVPISWLDSPGVISSNFYSIKGNSMAHFYDSKLFIIHMTLLKDLKVIPQFPFSFEWQEPIHETSGGNYFNLGTIGHFIHPKCVMPVEPKINIQFWKYRKIAAVKLQTLGYDIAETTGDKHLKFKKNS